MARRYVRDAKGRFAPKGYVGQTGGRGARLTSAGNRRAGGGAKANLLSPGDQAMTSVPKGTIGKTRKVRGLQKVDMTGQEFARFEAGKKAAKADISRRKQEAFFKETQKKLDNAPLARKSGAEMSKAEFARRTGGKTRADSMGAAIEMSRQPRGRTKAGDRRNEARLRKIQDEVKATDRAYGAAVKSGSVKKPTTSLARKAAGEPSNPAVQAAQRLQAKTAAKRAARRNDAASVNVPMSGSRGRRLDAEISRNVSQQSTAKRAESRARNAQFKSDQSRAKALRGKYGDQLAKDFAARSGRKVSEVKSTIKGMAPAQQVKLLTKAGREQRAKANLARTADTRNQQGSRMIRRPTQKMTRGNLRAERALEFYKDPKKALKAVNKTRRGFRMPRGLR